MVIEDTIPIKCKVEMCKMFYFMNPWRAFIATIIN